MPEVRRSNPKVFELLLGKLKELDGIETKVGWFPSAVYEPSGVPVALAMAANEFGHGPVPPRPFFRPTIAEQKTNWSKNAAQGSKAVLAGKLTAFQVMDGLGELAQEDVKETINQITSPPLSPITLELRAMKHKYPDLKITGAIVGQAAARVRQPGYQLDAGTPDKPLIDSKLAITTLTHTTETK